MIFRSLLVALALASSLAHAKRFRNAYVSFELPPNWNCKLEGSEWVCENDFSAKTKEAIIILTAKEVGPTDTLPAYLAHLQTPRTLSGRNGAPAKSQIIHVKERIIGNQMWVDGMHLGSEVGPYFTRYLATIKDRIAILITFSAHKQHYTKYSGDFIRAVESLKVVATKDTLGRNGDSDGGRRGEVEKIGPATDGSIPPLDGGGMDAEGSGRNSKTFNLLLIVIVLAAFGGYFFMRSKKKGPPKGQKRPPPPGGGGAPGGPPRGGQTPPQQKNVKR
jgi:hypothetical protein